MKKYLDIYIQKNSDSRGIKQLEPLFKLLDALSLKKVYCIIIESNDYVKTLIYLKAIDMGLIPILIPNSWTKSRQNEYVGNFSGAYIIENMVFSILGRPKRAPQKLWNTYGVFSSGSTSRPEISFLSISGAVDNARAHAKSLGITNKNTVIKILPVDHAFGVIAYIWTIIDSGAKLLQIDSFCGWEDLKKYNRTTYIIHLTPTWIHFLLNNNEESFKLRCTVSIGSSSLETQYIEKFKYYCHAKIFITYGLTEAGPRVSTGIWSISKNMDGYYFIGKAIGLTQLRILNNDHKIKETGKGILLIKSPSVRKNIKNKETLKSYLMTSDAAYIDNFKNIFLKSNQTQKFKFRDYLLDLNQIAQIISSTCIALSWINNQRAFWGLIYINKKQLDKVILQNINIKCHPKTIIRTTEMPTGNLNKIDIELCCQLLGIELNKSVQLFYSSYL